MIDRNMLRRLVQEMSDTVRDYFRAEPAGSLVPSLLAAWGDEQGEAGFEVNMMPMFGVNKYGHLRSLGEHYANQLKMVVAIVLATEAWMVESYDEIPSQPSLDPRRKEVAQVSGMAISQELAIMRAFIHRDEKNNATLSRFVWLPSKDSQSDLLMAFFESYATAYAKKKGLTPDGKVSS